VLKVPLTSILSAAIGGLILFIAASIGPVYSPISTAVAQPGEPRIIRNTMLDTIVELDAGVYHMAVVELVLDPRAETPLHLHPGPSVGFVESGRLSITVGSEVATYSTGSAFDHPWDRPHVMANNSDQSSKMLSFELNPVQ
jgi:quercetin dioxygenase-like cupin family protein